MPNRDNLAAMAVFARVVEDRSFTQAAGALGRSKSAVSKAVSQLEDRLAGSDFDGLTGEKLINFYRSLALIAAQGKQGVGDGRMCQSLEKCDSRNGKHHAAKKTRAACKSCSTA